MTQECNITRCPRSIKTNIGKTRTDEKVLIHPAPVLLTSTVSTNPSPPHQARMRYNSCQWPCGSGQLVRSAETQVPSEAVSKCSRLEDVGSSYGEPAEAGNCGNLAEGSSCCTRGCSQHRQGAVAYRATMSGGSAKEQVGTW